MAQVWLKVEYPIELDKVQFNRIFYCLVIFCKIRSFSAMIVCWQVMIWYILEKNETDFKSIFKGKDIWKVCNMNYVTLFVVCKSVNNKYQGGFIYVKDNR